MRPSVQPSFRSSVPALLAAGALVTSIGGGRVLSAAKGLTGIAILGSGSLLALVGGSALSLLVLRLARRTTAPRATAAVSALSGLFSVLLLLSFVLFREASRGAAASGGPVFHGAMAWLFFGCLVVRSSFSFAGRSLRSGLASSISRPLLSLTESMYFAGLMFGLLVGRILPAGADLPAAAFGLDLALQVSATACDLGVLRGYRRSADSGDSAVAGSNDSAVAGSSVTAGYGSCPQGPSPEVSAATGNALPGVFWRLTGAYSAAAVACQIVVFMLADTLARSPQAAVRALADPALAAFYLGIASAALFASAAKLDLVRQLPKGVPAVSWSGRHGETIVPAAVLCALSSVLTIAGVVGVTSSVGRFAVSTVAFTPGTLLSLGALAVGAGAFGIFALAVMGRIARAGSSPVALALAGASVLATGSMLLLLATSAGLACWIGVNVAGFLAALSLTGRALRMGDDADLALLHGRGQG